MFGAKKSDIKTRRYKDIAEFRDTFDDLPDGAFFAMAEERGIDVEDWGWFAEVEQLNPTTRKRGV